MIDFLLFEPRMARMEMDCMENDSWTLRLFHEIRESKFSSFDRLRIKKDKIRSDPIDLGV